MTKEEDFKLLKIQTCVLRVNIHCDGCKQKVKKILQRIEGVYQVNIDAEQQKVTVSGSVDSAALIKKLVRGGKHAELWSQKTNQNPRPKATIIKEDNKSNKGQKPSGVKGLESIKNKQKFPFMPEDDDCFDYDDDELDEEDEMQQLFRDKIKQLAMLKQQAEAANNSKKGGIAAMAANGNNSNNNGNAGKKGNQNPSTVMKGNHPGGIEQKALAATMNGEGRRGHDISAMMNLAGFHGNGANALGGNSNAMMGGGNGYQVQPNNNNLFPVNGLATGHNPSSSMMNVNGFSNYNNPSSMMMNLQNRQPQMMYNRSPFVPPTTGYYYNYSPVQVPYSYTDHGYIHGGDNSSASQMFSDENTSSCSIM